MEENIINQGWVKLEEENGIGTITFWVKKGNSLPYQVKNYLFSPKK